MTEICTKEWPLDFWYKVIQWGHNTFGPCQITEWYWYDDYSMFLSEENLLVFILTWA